MADCQLSPGTFCGTVACRHHGPCLYPSLYSTSNKHVHFIVFWLCLWKVCPLETLLKKFCLQILTGVRSSRRRHSVWPYFEDVSTSRVKCKVDSCGVILSATTSVTMGHLNSFHRDVFQSVTQEERAKQNLPNGVVPGRIFRDLQDTYMEYLAMWLLTSPTTPVSVVENKWFIKKEKLLKDTISVPGRKAIDGRMNEIHRRWKDLLKAELQEAQKITISLDIWTKKNVVSSFLGVLASYYSPSKKTKVILLLDVKKIQTITHLHQDILRELEDVLLDFEISRDKILFVITDSGSNMVAAFRDHSFDFEDPQDEDEELEIDLSDCPRLACMIHALLLCIKDFSMKVQNRSIIQKIQIVVTKFSHSHVLSAALKQATGRVLLKLSKTRWNVLFLVIKRMLEVQNDLIKLLRSSGDGGLLTPDDWVAMQKMADFLEPFHKYTDMSATDSISLFSEATMIIKQLLTHLESYRNSEFHDIATEAAERIKNTFWKRRVVVSNVSTTSLRVLRETFPVSAKVLSGLHIVYCSELKLLIIFLHYRCTWQPRTSIPDLETT